MRISSSAVLAITGVVALAGSVAAFTVGGVGVSSSFLSSSRRGGVNARPSSSSTMKLNMENPDEFIKSEISSNDVVVFAKSYCPHCKATKELFDGMGVDYKVHDLDKMGDDGPELQMALFKMTGQKTVPNNFVKGQHIGGNDDAQAAAAEGKLQQLLDAKA